MRPVVGVFGIRPRHHGRRKSDNIAKEDGIHFRRNGSAGNVPRLIVDRAKGTRRRPFLSMERTVKENLQVTSQQIDQRNEGDYHDPETDRAEDVRKLLVVRYPFAALGLTSGSGKQNGRKVSKLANILVAKLVAGIGGGNVNDKGVALAVHGIKSSNVGIWNSFWLLCASRKVLVRGEVVSSHYFPMTELTASIIEWKTRIIILCGLHGVNDHCQSKKVVS
jgi:hypothetical protein